MKHVSWETSRNFCGAIREYAESIGKNFFWLLGEVTGGAEMANDYLEIFGRNIEAVLDIGEPAANLTNFVKGLGSPQDFFDAYTGHNILGSHRETGRYHVSIIDDHDMVGRPKARFAAGNSTEGRYQQAAHVIGTSLTTLGTPCIYYGSEQAFAGSAVDGDGNLDPGFEDRYIRESMFGGQFGAFGTAGCHFFDSDHPTYLRVAAIARVRNAPDTVGMALRRGRQYPRETAFAGRPFTLLGQGELVAWSRVMNDQEVVVALNTNGAQPRGADITVDAGLHADLAPLRILYRGDWSDQQLCDPPADQTVSPVRHPDGRVTVRVDLPVAGMAILA